jgi:hypothetical protein
MEVAAGGEDAAKSDEAGGDQETRRTMRSKETPKTKQYPHPQEERAMTPRNAWREANARYANINLPSIT